GGRAELVHDAGPVRLHRLLTDAELDRHYLVRLPLHHLIEDRALARAQAGQPGAQELALLADAAAARVERQRLAHATEHRLTVDRLLEEVEGPMFENPDRRTDIREAGDDDDRQGHAEAHDLLLQDHAAFPRQPHVEHQAAGRVAWAGVQESLGAVERQGTEAGPLHQPGQRLARRPVVVHD